MQDLWVSNLMTKEVTTCQPGTLLTEVVRQLHNKLFSCLVVVNDNKPVGIITERDMVTILADMLEDVSWDSLSMENFMSAPPITIAEDYTLLEAVEIIRSEGVRHAPVVNGRNELVGLLTQTDIINGLYNAALEEAE
ncbi:MAG: CBS domain-containing protein [Pseudomonadales bacterium]